VEEWTDDEFQRLQALPKRRYGESYNTEAVLAFNCAINLEQVKAGLVDILFATLYDAHANQGEISV